MNAEDYLLIFRAAIFTGKIAVVMLLGWAVFVALGFVAEVLGGWIIDRRVKKEAAAQSKLPSRCPSCKSERVGRFCGNCGRKQHPSPQPLTEIADASDEANRGMLELEALLNRPSAKICNCARGDGMATLTPMACPTHGTANLSSE